MAFGINENSQLVAVGATDAEFTLPMQPGQQYVFTSNTNCFIRVSVTGAGGAATSSHTPVTAGQWVPLRGPERAGGATTNFFVHVIQSSASGRAMLAVVPG